MSLRYNLNVLDKTEKSTKHFQSQQKKKLQKFIKKEMGRS